MDASMKLDMTNSEIDQLEKVLMDFEDELELLDSKRSFSWRFQFLVSFVAALLMAMIDASFWWVAVAVIGYFAGSLYMMLRQRAQASKQIVEHQKQIKTARLLKNIESFPTAKE